MPVQPSSTLGVAPPAATGDRPIDLVHLARHAMGDAQLEREVLQLFVAQARVYVDRLKEAGDARTWRQTAHTIKGAARGIGAWRVAELAERAERMGFDPDDRRFRRLIADLEGEVGRASRFIEALFSKH